MSKVFNQYYFDVLKKLHRQARENKYDDRLARQFLKALKRHYQSWDTESDEYRAWFNGEDVRPAWDQLAAAASGAESNDSLVDALKQWLASVPETAYLYKDIPISLVHHIFKDQLAFFYFAIILCILRNDMPKEQVNQVLKTLKNMANRGNIPADLPQDIQTLLERAIYLHGLRGQSAASTAGSGLPNMAELESTSLGKLAKEIMSEVDVDELQKTIGENGDVLKALANPDSGLLKLVGTVSQKMVSKMASGEINQENLLSDALEFAGKMGGAIPGMGNLAGMGDLLSSVMGAAGGSAGGRGGGAGTGGGMPDFNQLMHLMQMMGGPSAGGSGSRSKKSGANARPNMAAANQHMRRRAQAKHLRDRLGNKQKQTQKQNVQADVGEPSSSDGQQ